MTRIVVGVDGSEGSQRALEWALREARLRQAVVEAAHAWIYPHGGPALMPPLEEMDRYEADQSALLDRAVSTATAAVPGVEVERHLVHGGAAPALITAGKGAELLVVGTRGRGGFAGLLLGSVSQQLSHHPPCPLVIVPTDVA